jgi:FkbM family methyltransferase
MRRVLRNAFASALHNLHTVKCGHRIADLRISAWLCGDGAEIAQLRYGVQAVVFVNEYNGRAMYLWGEHDPRMTAILDAVLRPGDTVLDIGANFGATGLFAAKRVGTAGTVHLFEPQPLLAQCLRTSLMINGLNAAVHECALSDQSGWAEMTILDPSNWGMTTLSLSELNSANRIRVRTENAGRYVDSLGCTNPSLVKIDIEGHEAVVLSSMRTWLAKQAGAAVILFECHLGGGEFFQHECVKLLSNLGYQFLAYDLKPFWRLKCC